MKRIEAIIRPTKAGSVCVALETAGFLCPRISQVEDKSLKSTGYLLRGVTYKADLVARARLEVIAKDAEADKIIKIIRDAALTGDNGDGEILVYAIEDAIRIKTGKSEEVAIY